MANRKRTTREGALIDKAYGRAQNLGMTAVLEGHKPRREINRGGDNTGGATRGGKRGELDSAYANSGCGAKHYGDGHDGETREAGGAYSADSNYARTG